MKMDMVQTEFCRVCVHVQEHAFFPGLPRPFPFEFHSCYFCKVKTPAFMAFMFHSLPKATAGSDLCFKGNCQPPESGGSLESLLIKRKPLRLIFPSNPL